jgi:hypothetical protein
MKVSTCFLDSKYCFGRRSRISEFLFSSLLLVDFVFASLLLVDFFDVSIIAGFRNNFQDHRRLSVCIFRVKTSLQGRCRKLLKGLSK